MGSGCPRQEAHRKSLHFGTTPDRHGILRFVDSYEAKDAAVKSCPLLLDEPRDGLDVMRVRKQVERPERAELVPSLGE